MNNRLTIRIKKRSQIEWLILLIVILPFLFGTLIELLGLPWSVRYLTDLAWGTLIVIMMQAKSAGQQHLRIWVLLFLFYTMLVYIPQWQSPLYYLWGVRNNFRYYAAFLAFAAFLKIDDVQDYLKLFDRIFWIDVCVSLYQFFVMKYDQDHLGGIFGVQAGVNGYANIFFLLITTISVVKCLEKQERVGICFLKCGTALIIAAMAELKFFIIEFLLMVSMAVLFTKFSWRKLVIILGTAVGVLACSILLTKIFPRFTGWLSLEWLLKNATSTKGYTTSGDLNRLNAIGRINEYWLKNGWQRIFGLGLGNCDTSNIAVVNTPFFESYGNMHYNWFTYSMMYLETGWLGLMFYWGFFVLVYIRILRIEKRSASQGKVYCRIGRIIAVMCVVISIYNASLRTEIGYLIYFTLAIPFACFRDSCGNRRMLKQV